MTGYACTMAPEKLIVDLMPFFLKERLDIRTMTGNYEPLFIYSSRFVITYRSWKSGTVQKLPQNVQPLPYFSSRGYLHGFKPPCSAAAALELRKHCGRKSLKRLDASTIDIDSISIKSFRQKPCMANLEIAGADVQ